MSVTISLDGIARFYQGLPEAVIDWLTRNIGLIYHKESVLKHNDQLIDCKHGRSAALNQVLTNIQDQYEYPHECYEITRIYACGWTFTRKRKLATDTSSLSLHKSTSTLLQIEDDSHALHFSLQWM